MDEPFSALDPITRSQLQDELIALQSKLKKTIIFVTHDMNEAIKLSDKICIINDGIIQQYDTLENILKYPANEFVIQFVGNKRIWDSPELIKVKDIMIDLNYQVDEEGKKPSEVAKTFLIENGLISE
ncbi:MAG: hypothetical protein LUH02_07350 [Erysipelotrichaceae bacterium]|nr:hypothetical protein [Erysipelotrichaceae bacterium]